MAHSLSFNLTDLSQYGLSVNRINWPMLFDTKPIQLHDKAVAYNSYKPAVVVSADIVIRATTTVALRSYIDNIRGVLNQSGDQHLTFDVMNDRYWLARLKELSGEVRSPNAFYGKISFLCLDPVAFSTTETTDGPTNIDADPKTIAITTGGNNRIRPVYQLIAGENLVGATITLENDETGDLLSYTGNVDNGHILEIDCEHWVVTNDGTEDMANVTGEFPELLSNQANDIIISGFSNTGTLTVVYRNRYR